MPLEVYHGSVEKSRCSPIVLPVIIMIELAYSTNYVSQPPGRDIRHPMSPDYRDKTRIDFSAQNAAIKAANIG